MLCIDLSWMIAYQGEDQDILQAWSSVNQLQESCEDAVAALESAITSRNELANMRATKALRALYPLYCDELMFCLKLIRYEQMGAD